MTIIYLFCKLPNLYLEPHFPFAWKSEIAGENLDYKSIIKELNIDIKNITVPDKPIHTNRGNTRGFKIKPKDLIEKIFDVKYIKEEDKKEKT